MAGSLGRYLLRELPNFSSELHGFSERVAGYWWSLGANPGTAGFASLSPDETANTLVISGRVYDPNGNVVGVWESAASCIYLNKKKLYYYWQGWWSERPADSHEGFGEISFHETAGRFDTGVGVFYDSNVTDLKSTTKKSADYRRCTQQEVDVMQGISKEAIGALLQSKLKIERDLS